MDPNPNSTIEKDELTGDKLISGHEYDNIKELDNRLPTWWLGLFIICIAFAFVYVFRYHILDTAPLQEDEYNNEMVASGALLKTAGPDAAAVDTATVAAMTEPAALATGKEVFTKNCVVCHLAGGQGLVGPNLTDDYWIHGCSYKEILTIIINGVPEKGMISWKAQLSNIQIQQVASYILTLKGTNPPNPKPPQGDKCQ